LKENDLDKIERYRVHHMIWKKEHEKRQSVLRRFTRICMKAAAILLLPLMIAGGLVYSYPGYHSKTTTDQQVRSTIIAPLGARVSFNLPDDTTGMLNSFNVSAYPAENYVEVVLQQGKVEFLGIRVKTL